MRKIIQIAASECEESEAIFALCDDGTIWCKINPCLPIGHSECRPWKKIENVPQPPVQPE